MDGFLAEEDAVDVIARRACGSDFKPFALDASAVGSTTIDRKTPFAVPAAGPRPMPVADFVASPRAWPSCFGRVR